MQVKRMRGFSLIELMTVLVVLAIFTSIGIPSFHRFIVSQTIKNAASPLQSALLLARSEALKRNLSVSVNPVVAGDWTSGWAIADPLTAALIANYEAKASISIAGPASITYQPDGRITGSAAVFKVSSVDDSTTLRCVSITLTGLPAVASSGC